MSKIMYIPESQLCPEGYKDGGLTRETRARAAGGTSARQRICVKETVKVSELDDLLKGFRINESSSQSGLSSLFSGKAATKAIRNPTQSYSKKTVKSKAAKRNHTMMKNGTRKSSKPTHKSPEKYVPIETATNRNLRQLTRQMEEFGELNKHGESNMFAAFKKPHKKNQTTKKNKKKNNNHNLNM